ncbi:BamA/TamA family outer membrane protein [Pedobacter metabolipauper]|uniref:Surface antigen-like protein n=1 Tax=Pedobacter metabolipauper TaxID=425513 RepID=A0A4R6T156_9SPHI|nr:BamA/TamA family outer membrane protein [Pedobacter metabolipauper]TDQ11328.1 surface antigen-like protein [Pedobacter metabolipauper]
MNVIKNLFILALVLFTIPAIAQKPGSKDSITIAIGPEYDSVSKTHRLFLGESYRKIWATPIKVRIIDLQKEQGGFKIVKLGGGMQTRSLRLVDPTGKEWALRTIQKYPERGLPESLKPTIAKDIVQDQVSTNHPFAALIVPPLAEALGLAHSKPEIVYVGDDPALGEYRKDFANAAYLLEPRSPFEEETDNTLKVQRKIQEDNDTRADQKLMLRARLLDFVLGDWDRHEDNWRWLPQKEKGETTYIPVPRDRDKVFYKTSGLFPWVLNHQWLKSHLQPYSDNIRDVNHWNFNERFLDRYFLNELSEKDWQTEVKFVQDKLTSALINSAFRQMPDTIFKLSGPELIRSFTSRRDKLDTLALQYYRFLSIDVDVPASDKKEFFEVKYKDNGEVELTVHNINKEGKQGRKVYQRTFSPEVTREIRLFGMAGDDVFSVIGKEDSKIKVRMIGGGDADTFEIAAGVKNKPFIYDRSDEQNNYPDRSSAKFRLAKDTLVNRYDKNSFLYDRSGPLFSLNYNIDQGLQIAAGYVYEKQGFRKNPYASKHEFWANYSTGRKSFILDYVGDFKKAIGNNDLIIHGNLLGPNNLSNFFGIGNNSEYLDIDYDDEEEEEEADKEDGISYYRNRYNYFNADIRISRKVTDHLRLEGGVITSIYSSTRSGNEERFFNDYNAANPEEEIFSEKYYGGLVAAWIYDTRDNAAVPSKGLYWKTSFLAQHRLDQTDDRYGSVTTEFRFYINPGKSGLVFANRIGAGTVIGEPAFFQRMQIGGVNSLRGFNSKRFTGTTMAYHNLDMRLRLFNFTSYLVPGTVGMIAFNDVGRVWEKGEHSSRWHQGYGGGLYVMPGEVILIQASVGFSREATMPYFSVGFNF